MSRLCACVLIVAVTVACFWIYDRIAHRGSAYGPLSLRAHAVDYRSDRLSTPAALAPDMNSDAVRHANADVPDELQKPEQKPAPQKAKHEAAPHRKRNTEAGAGAGDAGLCLGSSDKPDAVSQLLGPVVAKKQNIGG